MQLPVFLTLILFSSNIISKPNMDKYMEEKTRYGAKVNSVTNKEGWMGRIQTPWIEKITPPPHAWPHYEPYLQYEDGLYGMVISHISQGKELPHFHQFS